MIEKVFISAWIAVNIITLFMILIDLITWFVDYSKVDNPPNFWRGLSDKSYYIAFIAVNIMAFAVFLTYLIYNAIW